MSNSSTALRGLCPAPFYDVSLFDQGGFVDGRFCAAVGPGLTCCLPCPMTDFLYPPHFNTFYRVAEGLNVTGLVLLVFLLLSFMVLPAEKTRRHYLSYCIIIAAMFMALGFVIPLGANPKQCYNEITPNDMYSSLPCALSGAFLISGGLSMAVWIFIRTLSMHLQICWDVAPGQKFFYWAQGLGWSVAAAFFTVTITVTGVSFRFGEVCHVNAAHSMIDLWGPLLAMSAAVLLLQVFTFVYCVKVYLQYMFSDEADATQSSAGLPSYSTSMRTRSARAVYRRVRKVLWLQWRGITVVVFVLVDVILFSVVFIWLNALSSKARENPAGMAPFLGCLLENPTDPSPCFEAGQKMSVNESTVVAVLMMLSIVGIQVFALLARSSMYGAWFEFFRNKLSKNREFVSLDARHPAEPEPSPNYELKKLEDATTQPPTHVLTLPPEIAGFKHFRSDTPDYFQKEAQRQYITPTLSFSTPRPQSRSAAQTEWDLRSTHARGGLGFHPPDVEPKV
ncbi:hypothetical protein ACEQ8H_005165 [Pleosporales sp. CAS-2024a]